MPDASGVTLAATPIICWLLLMLCQLALVRLDISFVMRCHWSDSGRYPRDLEQKLLVGRILLDTNLYVPSMELRHVSK